MPVLLTLDLIYFFERVVDFQKANNGFGKKKRWSLLAVENEQVAYCPADTCSSSTKPLVKAEAPVWEVMNTEGHHKLGRSWWRWRAPQPAVAHRDISEGPSKSHYIVKKMFGLTHQCVMVFSREFTKRCHINMYHPLLGIKASRESTESMSVYLWHLKAV